MAIVELFSVSQHASLRCLYKFTIACTLYFGLLAPNIRIETSPRLLQYIWKTTLVYIAIKRWETTLNSFTQSLTIMKILTKHQHSSTCVLRFKTTYMS